MPLLKSGVFILVFLILQRISDYSAIHFRLFRDTFQILQQLFWRACSNEHTRHALLLQNPSKSHLGESLALRFCLRIEVLQMCKQLRCEHAMLKEMLASHAAVLRNTVEIAVGEKSLGEWRERNETHTVLRTVVENALILRRMVKHIESTLIYQERNIMLTQILVGYLQRLKRPTADAYIQRLALTHNVYQSRRVSSSGVLGS